MNLMLLSRAEPFLCSNTKFIIPFLAETTDKWLLQELISSHSLGASFPFGTAAYLPTMEIDGGKIAYTAQTHRIKMA